jgi:hypothetical protein
MSNYTFKARKTPEPGRRAYTVMRNSDELVVGWIYRDASDAGWTAVDVADSEAWQFTDRESAAQSLEFWYGRAIAALAARADEPEMIEDVQLTIDDFETAISCVRFLVESFGAGLGPVFSCVEAETIVALARSCAVDDDLIDRFKKSHVADDEPGDAHHGEWPAEQTLGPKDSGEMS